jgi:Core-2/I-Branching enzyme
MAPTVGFVLLTHNKPHQVVRLVNTLNRMFDRPPIACHHDFSKCDLPKNLASNVALVHPHFQTGWGKFSVIDAMLSALMLMYESPDAPDWFVLLSGADYPIKPAQQILDDLATSPYDVHIPHELIQYKAYERHWQEHCHYRYCSVKFKIPSINKKLQLTQRQITLEHPLLTAPFLPFSKNFRCFAGEHWFCANRKAAQYLIEFHKSGSALADHYRSLDIHTMTPDESYYHTIFCNAPHLKVSQNHWRYIDWSGKGAHPKILQLEDLPEIQSSSAHFARKFDIDGDTKILDALDGIIG